MDLYSLSRSTSECSGESPRSRSPSCAPSSPSSDSSGPSGQTALDTSSFAVFGAGFCHAVPLELDVPACGNEEGAPVTLAGAGVRCLGAAPLFTLQARSVGTTKLKARLRDAAGADVASFDHAPSCAPGSSFRLHVGGRCVTSCRVGSAKTSVLRGQPCIKVVLRGLPYVGIVISGDFAGRAFKVLQHMPGRRSERLLALAAPSPWGPDAVRLSVAAGVDVVFAVALACMACASAGCADAAGARRAADSVAAAAAAKLATEAAALPAAPLPAAGAPPRNTKRQHAGPVAAPLPPQSHPPLQPQQQWASLPAGAPVRQYTGTAQPWADAIKQHPQPAFAAPAAHGLAVPAAGLLAQLLLSPQPDGAGAALSMATGPSPLQLHMQQHVAALQQREAEAQAQVLELQELLVLLARQQQEQAAERLRQAAALRSASLAAAAAVQLQQPLQLASEPRGQQPVIPF